MDSQVGDTTCRTVMELATREIGARPAAPEEGHSVSVVSNLLREAEVVYTNGSYRSSGKLFERIRGSAIGEGSASIVARGYDGSYRTVRMDLTGMIDSAVTAKLVGAAVAGSLGSGHRDQVTDCKSLLAIEARARTDKPVKYHQRGLLAGIKQARHRLRWHRSHPGGRAQGGKTTLRYGWRTRRRRVQRRSGRGAGSCTIWGTSILRRC